MPFFAGTSADFRIKDTTEPTNFDWLARSSDPMTAEVVVPEPATLGLLALGGLAMLRRRTKR